MIDVSAVLGNTDMIAPQPFTVTRSSGMFTAGGYTVTSTAVFTLIGPVQRAGDKEVKMLPEADRIEAAMAFWATVPIYTTRDNNQDALTAQGQAPTPNTVPANNVFTLNPPSDGNGLLLKNGLLLLPTVDYSLSSDGTTITLNKPLAKTDALYYQPLQVNPSNSGLSDIVNYDGLDYRIMAVRHYPGSGYWRALGTRMRAA